MQIGNLSTLYYYLFLLLVVSIVVLFYIYYENYQDKKQNLARGEVVGLWDKNMKERRRFKRLETALDVRYEISNTLKAAGEMKTRDLSEGGIGVVIYEKLSAGTPLRIWVNSPDIKETIFLLGEIVWLKEVFQRSDRRTFYAGIRFTTVDTPTQLQLSDFLYNLAQKNKLHISYEPG